MVSIVLADDEKLICDSLQSILNQNITGIKIDAVFNTGCELKEYLLHHDVDLLITDIEMPGATGIEVTKLLRESGKQTHVVFVTAFRRFEYAMNALEYKVDAYIVKPYASANIIGTIQEIVKTIESEQQISPLRDNLELLRNTIRLLCQSRKEQASNQMKLPDGKQDLWTAPCLSLQLLLHEWDALAQGAKNAVSAFFQSDFHPEMDTHGIFSVFLGNSGGQFHCLMFCAATVELAPLIQKITNALSSVGISNVESLTAPFASFHKFHAYQRCVRMRQTFAEAASAHGLQMAAMQLNATLKLMSETELEALCSFLRDEYNAPLTTRSLESIQVAMEETISDSSQSNQSKYLVRAAKDYVKEHYASSQLSLQETADALGISPSYLSRKFKEIRGISFSSYCQMIRMNKSKALLITTTMSVSDIASAVGYAQGNSVAFRKVFKSVFGMTPRQYRETHGIQGENE